MKIREQQCYKAYYCGICREIGKNFGQVPRFGLTHEFAVLSMVLSCVVEHTPPVKIVKRPCIAHPFRKTISYSNNPFITYGAALNVLFIQSKLKDNWKDERQISALLGQSLFVWGSQKAGRTYRDLKMLIEKAMETLADLEQNQCMSVDEIAHPFADLIGRIFTIDGLIPQSFAVNLYQLGYHLGKWIYLIDALSDREKDRKKGIYNVYNLRYGTESLPAIEKTTRELSLAHIAEAWEHLKRKAKDNTKSEQGYLDNLFYLGLRTQEDNVGEEKGGDKL